MTEADIPSPCTGHCQMHPRHPWCAGCGRSLAEIERWPTATPAQKRAILARLPERLKQV
jgi:predicted Fe-S protein YdhL (DUF1289 family)